MKKVQNSSRKTRTHKTETDPGHLPLEIKARKRTGKKKGGSILETVKTVKIEVVEPLSVSPVRPLSLAVPGFSTETTEIGVAGINNTRAMYLRLTLRSDN